jgi:hypothetical protein
MRVDHRDHVELDLLPSSSSSSRTRDSNESTAYDPEAEPFLPGSDEAEMGKLGTGHGGSSVRNGRTPLPVRQLAALCAVRLVDPIAFTQVFPYVNEMIDDLHLTNDPSRLGFYSGLVVSDHSSLLVWRYCLNDACALTKMLAGKRIRGLPALLYLPVGSSIW